MPLLLLPFVPLLACGGGDDGPALRTAPGSEDEIVPWSPDGDDADDTSAPDDPWGEQATQACGGAAGEPGWGTGDRLPADFCVRLSPEPDDEDSGPSGPAAPPCTFTNLVGALDLDSATATVLYCDSDGDGGMRLATYDPEADALQSRTLHPRDCVADGDSGVLRLDAGGWTAWWASLGTGEDGAIDPGVLVATLGETGDDPDWRYVVTGGAPYRVRVLGGVTPHLVVLDSDGGLDVWPLDGRAAAGAAVRLDEGIRSVEVLDEGGWIATCQGDDRLSLRTLHGPPTELPGTGCGFTSRPALQPAPDGGVAVAWDDGTAGFLARLDAAGRVTWTAPLGATGLLPRVLPWQGGWLTLDGSGRVRAWDDAGALRWEARHAGLADVSSSVTGIRADIDGDRLTVLHLAMDVRDMGSGHVAAFSSVELSRVILPE